MLIRSFPELVRRRAPRKLDPLRSATPSKHLFKLYYGNRDLHYEASHHGRRRTREIGLHFEADSLTNARLLGAFRAHERAIHRTLPTARFEEWDRGWTRIWEPIAYERLDGLLGDRLAERLALYIRTLEPVLRDELPADVAWSLSL